MTTIHFTKQTLSNTDDILDSRDIIEALDELKEMAVDEFMEANPDFEGDFDDLPQPWLTDEFSENNTLVSLAELCDDGEGFADWIHGETLIHDNYFAQYAKEMASDVCDMSSVRDWPFRHIDWQEAAEELQQDYTTIDFDGEQYWIRS